MCLDKYKDLPEGVTFGKVFNTVNFNFRARINYFCIFSNSQCSLCNTLSMP